jgi:hypothetical protein
MSKVRNNEDSARTARNNNKHLFNFGAKVAEPSAGAAAGGGASSDRDAYSLRSLSVRHRFTDPMTVDATVSPGWIGNHRCALLLCGTTVISAVPIHNSLNTERRSQWGVWACMPTSRACCQDLALKVKVEIDHDKI